MDKTLQGWKSSALRPSELVFPLLWVLPLGFGGPGAWREGMKALGSTAQPILLRFCHGEVEGQGS